MCYVSPHNRKMLLSDKTMASDVSSKEHQDLMARCWFSLAKQKRTESIEHHFGDNWVKITADEKYGLATIFDNDVLIYVIAQSTGRCYKSISVEQVSIALTWQEKDFYWRY